VLPALHSLLSQPGHAFWPDDISLLGDRLIAQDRLLTSGQLTDTYLLALAVSNGGRLATFDRRLAPDAVKGGKAALHLITA
jgi:predicted nucleic acid-binding protein